VIEVAWNVVAKVKYRQRDELRTEMVPTACIRKVLGYVAEELIP
jgi:hypothetical protein